MKKEIQKEKLLQFISKAIDEGVKIDLLFYGNGESKQTALKRIHEFSEILGDTPVTEHQGERCSNWLSTELNFKAKMSHFYDHEYMEEDVDLTGGEEHVTA